MRRVQYEGELTYVPVTEQISVSSRLLLGHQRFNVTSSTYGTYTVIPTSIAGIVDTGTTRMFPSPRLHAHSLDLTRISSPLEVLLMDNFFAVYLDAIPGAKLDSHTRFIEIPPSSISSMQLLNFMTAH
jgi:hypothetical protein